MTTPCFTFPGFPARLVFGPGRIDAVGDELERLGARRVFLFTGHWLAAEREKIVAQLGARHAGTFDRSVMHVPAEVVEEACAAARAAGADCLLAFGGGSTLDLAKAVTHELDLPILAVPTTYGGSEVTPVYGVTSEGVKRTFRDPRLLARTVVYDPALTTGLPRRMTAASGINAIAHAAEALYAADGSPLTALLAEEGIRRLADGLPRAVAEPADLDARGDCLFGSALCGMVLGLATMGLQHRLSHTVGGSFGLPHAEVHSIVLSHALRFNAPAAPQAMARIARALGADDAADGIAALRSRLGLPSSLREIGMKESDLDLAARIATGSPLVNPRPCDTAGVRSLLGQAWRGEPA